MENEEFHINVAAGYRRLAEANPTAWRVVDGSGEEAASRRVPSRRSVHAIRSEQAWVGLHRLAPVDDLGPLTARREVRHERP